MRIVKLDAVDSTNDFLKSLCRNSEIENFTVVTAENQLRGKGQMGARWGSEPGKNLTFSMLIRDVLNHTDEVFLLNAAVALSIASALEKFGIPDVSVKWPNDIMSGKKKIAGILIENVIRGDGQIWSVAGIGLNVNQLNFDGFPKASSMAIAGTKTFDRDEVLGSIIKELRALIDVVVKNPEELRAQYHLRLFRRDILSCFSDGASAFNGIIRGISSEGLLLLETDNGLKQYNLKEIELLY